MRKKLGVMMVTSIFTFSGFGMEFPKNQQKREMMNEIHVINNTQVAPIEDENLEIIEPWLSPKANIPNPIFRFMMNSSRLICTPPPPYVEYIRDISELHGMLGLRGIRYDQDLWYFNSDGSNLYIVKKKCEHKGEPLEEID